MGGYIKVRNCELRDDFDVYSPSRILMLLCGLTLVPSYCIQCVSMHALLSTTMYIFIFHIHMYNTHILYIVYSCATHVSHIQHL